MSHKSQITLKNNAKQFGSLNLLSTLEGVRHIPLCWMSSMKHQFLSFQMIN